MTRPVPRFVVKVPTWPALNTLSQDNRCASIALTYQLTATHAFSPRLLLLKLPRWHSLKCRRKPTRTSEIQDGMEMSSPTVGLAFAAVENDLFQMLASCMFTIVCRNVSSKLFRPAIVQVSFWVLSSRCLTVWSGVLDLSYSNNCFRFSHLGE